MNKQLWFQSLLVNPVLNQFPSTEREETGLATRFVFWRGLQNPTLRQFERFGVNLVLSVLSVMGCTTAAGNQQELVALAIDKI